MLRYLLAQGMRSHVSVFALRASHWDRLMYPFADLHGLGKAGWGGDGGWGARESVSSLRKTSGVGSPAFNRSIRCGRVTSPIRAGGEYSFVCSSECCCMNVLHVT